MLNRRTGYQGNQPIQQNAIVMRRWIRAICRAASHGYVKRAEPPACQGHCPSSLHLIVCVIDIVMCTTWHIGEQRATRNTQQTAQQPSKSLTCIRVFGTRLPQSAQCSPFLRRDASHRASRLLQGRAPVAQRHVIPHTKFLGATQGRNGMISGHIA
jgi:hypothetical protein